MIYTDPHLVRTLQVILEFLGTFAFAISGIRHAAQKHFDWFGGYVCGFAVAIGGGTIRDTMLGVRPFWMANIMYVLCTGLALFLVILSRRWIQRLSNAWFVFDTLGLALFTIAGIQKTIALGHPFWVAVIMGCITGVAGGVIRDVLLNNIPRNLPQRDLRRGKCGWRTHLLGTLLARTTTSDNSYCDIPCNLFNSFYCSGLSHLAPHFTR